MSANEDTPLRLDLPQAVEQVRLVLDKAGYSEDVVRETLNAAPASLRQVSRLPFWLWQTRQGAPLDVLVRLFLLGQPVDRAAARRAVTPMDLTQWAELGLVETAGETVTAAVQLVPDQGLVAAVDWPGRPADAWKQVMGIAASTRALLQCTIRRPAGLALDLGAGCGIQAFHAARHCERVVGVDLNPRAVHLARFNAQLNGLANVEFREGDFFEPVRGQQFDLILANPPFLIAPRTAHLFNDSGMKGDALCQKLVRTAPEFLRDGGFCQIVSNFAMLRGQEWRGRLAGWFKGTGCAAWVLNFRTEEVALYAGNQLRQAEGEESAERFNEWMAYYEQEGIEAIGFGLITMRRRAGGGNWVQCSDAPPVQGPCGAAILGGFDRFDFLERARDDQVLLAARLRPAPDLRLDQELTPAAGAWSPAKSSLRLGSGLTFAGNADERTLALVARCRGQERLRDILTDLAGPGADVRGGLALVRRLLANGMLVPE